MWYSLNMNLNKRQRSVLAESIANIGVGAFIIGAVTPLLIKNTVNEQLIASFSSGLFLYGVCIFLATRLVKD